MAVVGLVLGCRERPRATAQAAAAPRRVVALAPNLTEIVFALGAGDALVGVSEYSDYPEAARAIPRVGGLEIDAEKVAALRPDLVLAVAEGNAQGSVRALEAAGLPVDGHAVRIARRGAREHPHRRPSGSAGPKRGGAWSPSSSGGVPPCARRTAGRTRPRTLLLVWPDPPQAAGGRTFLNDLLDRGRRATTSSETAAAGRSSPASTLATAPVELLVVPDSGRDAAGLGPRVRVGRAVAGPGRARPPSCASTRRS